MVDSSGKIIWLASYPKSGNTWLRIFLNFLLSESNDAALINELTQTGPIASSRLHLDELIGVDSSDLTQEEIDYYLPRAHALRSKELDKIQFVKTHDGFVKNSFGEWIIPLEATYKAIYLIRNPLDVCVSYAFHSGHAKFDRTIKVMNQSNLTLAKSKRRQNNQLHQYMGSWSEHVKSWSNVDSSKLLVIRYEDMKRHSSETFAKIVQFAELDYSQSNIDDALEGCQIEKLQKQEDEVGFREKMQGAKNFFRKGVIGDWKEHLNESQIKELIDCHREVMIKYNYMNEEGQLSI